jgi:cell wall hydrolase
MRTDHKTFRAISFARLGLIMLVITAAAAAETVAQRNSKSSTRPARKQAQASITRSEVREAEQLLADLGYWTGTIDGRMDQASRQALIAFQKIEGRLPRGQLTRDELEALRGASRPQARDRSLAAHVEVDLSRQVLFIIDSRGQVSKVLSISSGNGEEFTSEGWTRSAVTPKGRFKVHNKIDGWRKSPLGMLYYPVYFLSGIAIHGSPSVPAYPASHGCIRIPLFAAKEFSEIIPIGTWIIVHDGSPMREAPDLPTAHK